MISKRSTRGKKQRDLLPPLTCYNDLQTRVFFLLLRKEHLPTFGCFFTPSLRPSASLLPDRPLCRRIRDGTTPPSLKQTNPTVFTPSVFARYFLFSPTLQLGARARTPGFVGRGEYRMIYPFATGNSRGKLCLAGAIFQFRIDFKVLVCTILRFLRHSRCICSRIQSNSRRLPFGGEPVYL